MLGVISVCCAFLSVFCLAAFYALDKRNKLDILNLADGSVVKWERISKNTIKISMDKEIYVDGTTNIFTIQRVSGFVYLDKKRWFCQWMGTISGPFPSPDEVKKCFTDINTNFKTAPGRVFA